LEGPFVCAELGTSEDEVDVRKLRGLELIDCLDDGEDVGFLE
jgi:hypothetical protein